MAERLHRKLTTVMSADVAGYSRLMEADEVGTLERLTDYRAALSAFIERHRGRVVNTAGDSLLAEFDSVVEAVLCAAEVQRELGARNAALEESRQMRYRIGINLGDVMVEGDDLFGEGVNIAARLQGLAEPGGLCISGSAYDQVRGKLSLGYDFLGPQSIKNIAEQVPVYRVRMDGEAAADEMRAERAASPQADGDGGGPTATSSQAGEPAGRARAAGRIYLLFLLSLVFAFTALVTGGIAERDLLRGSSGKIEGDAAFTEDTRFSGKVGGNVVVAPGITLKMRGEIGGDLTLGPQALAEVHGKIGGDVINHGGALRLRGKLDGSELRAAPEAYAGPPASEAPEMAEPDEPEGSQPDQGRGRFWAGLAGALGLGFALTLLAGVVLAYVNREAPGDGGDWLDSHYRFQIRTFWIGMLFLLGGGVTLLVGLGLIVLALLPFWLLIRCLRGRRFLLQGRPHPKPGSWLIG